MQNMHVLLWHLQIVKCRVTGKIHKSHAELFSFFQNMHQGSPLTNSLFKVIEQVSDSGLLNILITFMKILILAEILSL